MPKAAPQQKHHPVTINQKQRETAIYIGEMQKELAFLAHKAQLPFLAYLINLAIMEADSLACMVQL